MQKAQPSSIYSFGIKKSVYFFEEISYAQSRIFNIKKRSVTSDRNAVTSFGQYFNQTHLLIDYGPTSHNFFSSLFQKKITQYLV